MILGIGLDVCDVARIRRALEAPTGARFRARVFTDEEQAFCEARRHGRFASYAARFAAKEAAMKALGTGWARGVGWRDFEVVRATDAAPRLVVHGRAATIARRAGIGRWLLALSHTARSAVASVIAEGEPPGVAGEEADGLSEAAASAPGSRRGAGARSGRRRPRRPR